MAKEEKIPLIPLQSLPVNLRTTLPSLVAEYRRIHKDIEDRKSSLDDIKSTIESLVSSLPPSHKKIGDPDSPWYLLRKRSTTTSLNKHKLVSECVSRGVDPILVTEIISFSTESKVGKEYIQVFENKEKKTENIDENNRGESVEDFEP